MRTSDRRSSRPIRSKRRRRWIAPDLVLLSVVVLLLCALTAVAGAPIPEVRTRVPAGAGLGRTTALSPCTGAFDPRLGVTCDLRHGPVPGFGFLCADHLLPPADGALR